MRGATVMLRELSPWTMFLSADLLVKAVMIGLAFASLVTWTIFFAKMFELSRAQSRAKRRWRVFKRPRRCPRRNWP